MSVGTWLGLLGLVAVPIIVLIYIIKSKYVPKTVSSTYIWQRSLKYVKRRIPINFLMSLLLIMQILVVVAATLALMDIKTEPNKSQASIVVVDASASMKAQNGDKTRYEIALEKLKAEAKNVGPNSGMVIILASDVPEVITEGKKWNEELQIEETTPYLYDKDEVILAIDKKLTDRCTNTNTDINAALDMAQNAVNLNKEAKIYLYTDRLYDDNDTVQVINCADPENDWNAGIISFTDTNLAAGYEYRVTLINEGKEAEFAISLNVDGGIVATKKVTMGKSETKEFVFSPRSTDNSDAIKIKSIKSYSKAEVEINTSTDVISDDNKAYLNAVEGIDIRILYVSNAVKMSNGGIDYVYQTTLQRSMGSSGFVINTSDIFHASQIDKAPMHGYDLYIYEGVMPVSMPKDGAVWFINAPSSPVGTNIAITDVVKDAAEAGKADGFMFSKSSIALKPNAQLITKNVNFDEPIRFTIDGVEKAIPAALSKYTIIGEVNDKTGEVKYTIPEYFEEVYSCSYDIKIADKYVTVKTPVMLVGTVGTTRTIVTTFDFTNSSLPAFIADFPVLLKNMVEYSMPETLPERTPTIGDKLQFNAPAGAESITYYYKSFEEEAEDPTSLGKEVNRWDGTTLLLPDVILDKLGIYSIVVNYTPEIVFDEDGEPVEIKEEPDTFAVSTYVPLSESDISARGPRLSAPTPGEEAQIDRNGRPILWIVVLVLIALLIVEWGVYYRDEY